jgi:hypothetical protein
MSIISDAKEIADLVKAMGNIDLYRKIVDLQTEIIGVIQEKNEIERRMMELNDAIEQGKSMSYKKPFWFKTGDDVAHCPRCWEVEKKAVHLIGPRAGVSQGPRYDCPQCKAFFYHPAQDPAGTSHPRVIL